MCDIDYDDMDKPKTVSELIINLCQDALCYKLTIPEVKELKFTLSRMKSIPPSSIYLEDIDNQLRVRADESYELVRRFIMRLIANSKYKDKQFIINPCNLSTKDLYNGYIEIVDSDGKEYILFLNSYDNGILSVKEGELLSYEEGVEISKVMPTVKKKFYNSLYQVLIERKEKQNKRQHG